MQYLSHLVPMNSQTLVLAPLVKISASWKTELDAMCMAAWLSQCIVIDVVVSMPKSLIKFLLLLALHAWSLHQLQLIYLHCNNHWADLGQENIQNHLEIDEGKVWRKRWTEEVTVAEVEKRFWGFRDEIIREYLSVLQRMRNNGETLSNTKVVEKILKTLSEKFMCVVLSRSQKILKASL